MASPQGPPTGPAGGHWVAHLSPDGRPFWNHSVTKQSVWEKPSELKTPVEKEMENTPWKEYVYLSRRALLLALAGSGALARAVADSSRTQVRDEREEVLGQQRNQGNDVGDAPSPAR